MSERIDHIGIAVADVAAALRVYRDLLGLDLESVEEVASQKLTTYHLRLGESAIELLSPTDPSSAVGRFLEKHGPGIHHVSIAVADLDAARARLVAGGMEPIGDPSTGAGGKRIQFFHPRTTGGVLLEICSEA
ncbi:MAG: methylmalonyl-CoA epimerase [Candidatus Eisenbacteria bacterium]|nr:methylmalonyl-CoA epimerase [Candidatus Eisenbacteria bacterium]